MDRTESDEIDEQEAKLSEYPENHRGGRLLGVTGNGHAAYLSENGVVFFAAVDSTGDLTTPPPDFGRASELELAEFDLSVAAFLKRSANEHGNWQTLTPFARDHLDIPPAELQSSSGSPRDR